MYLRTVIYNFVINLILSMPWFHVTSINTFWKLVSSLLYYTTRFCKNIYTISISCIRFHSTNNSLNNIPTENAKTASVYPSLVISKSTAIVALVTSTVNVISNNPTSNANHFNFCGFMYLLSHNSYLTFMFATMNHHFHYFLLHFWL